MKSITVYLTPILALFLLSPLFLSSQTLVTDFENSFASTYSNNVVLYQDTLYNLNFGTPYEPSQFSVTMSDGQTTEVLTTVEESLHGITDFEVTPSHVLVGDSQHLFVISKSDGQWSSLEYHRPSIRLEGDSIYITHHDGDYNHTLEIWDTYSLDPIDDYSFDSFIGVAEDFHFYEQSIYTDRDNFLYKLNLDSFVLDSFDINYSQSNFFYGNSFISLEEQTIVSINLSNHSRDTINETESYNLYAFDQYYGYFVSDNYIITDLESQEELIIENPEIIYRYSSGYLTYQLENEAPYILSLKDWGSEPKQSEVINPFSYIAEDNLLLSIFNVDMKVGLFNFDTGEEMLVPTNLINLSLDEIFLNGNPYVIGSTVEEGRELHRVTDSGITLVEGLPNIALGGAIEIFKFKDAVFLSPQIYNNEPDGIYLLTENGYITIGTEYDDVFDGGSEVYYLSTSNTSSIDPLDKQIYSYDLSTGLTDSITNISLFNTDKLYDVYQYEEDLLFFFDNSITHYESLTETHTVIDSSLTDYYYTEDLLFYATEESWWLYDLNDHSRSLLFNISGFTTGLSEVVRYDDYVLIPIRESNNDGVIISYNLNSNTSNIIFNENPRLMLSEDGNSVFFRYAGGLYFTDGTNSGTNYIVDIDGLITKVYHDYLITYDYLPNSERATTLIDIETKEKITLSDFHYGSHTRIGDLLYLQTDDNLDILDLRTKEFVQSLETVSSTSNVAFRDFYFFNTSDSSVGKELHYIDPVTYEIVNVYDILPGSTSSQVQDFLVYEDDLYFQAYHDGLGRQLWKMDNSDVFTSVNAINTLAQINLSPNPVSNVLTLNTDHQSPEQLHLSTLDGLTVLKRNYTNSLDLSNLSSGVYLLSILDQEGNLIASERVVKM